MKMGHELLFEFLPPVPTLFWGEINISHIAARHLMIS